MSKYVDYTRLRTIADVREERRRINRRLTRATQNLGEDLDEFLDLFTLDYWLDFVGRRIENFNSTVKAAYSGVRMVTSLFRGK